MAKTSVLVTAGLVAAAILVAPAGVGASTAQEAGGTVTVSPDTGLVDEQVVTVHGSGFEPHLVVDGEECVAPGGDDDCRSGFDFDATTDGAGAFTVTIRLEAEFGPWANPPPVDCRTSAGTCVLRMRLYNDDVEPKINHTVLVPLTFDPIAPLAPAPTIAVAPATGLIDGHQIEVTGAGFDPDDGWHDFEVVEFSECTTPVFTHGTCAHPAVDDEPVAFVEPDGTISQPVRLRATYGAGANHTDCRVTPCYLVASEDPSFGDQASVPLAFDPDAPLFDPHIHLTVSPSSGLADGQAVAVGATGFYPDEHPAIVLECAENAAGDFLGCTNGQTHTAGPDGTLHLDFVVDEQFQDRQGGPAVDCMVDRCFIGSGRPSGVFPDVRVAIAFAEASAATPTAAAPTFTG